MNTILWIIQVILAVFFLMPGVGKISNSKQKHIADGHLKPNASVNPIRILGILELLGCIGIVLPWFSGIYPVLTPITALCFCGIMIAGMVIHIQKKEYKMLPMLFSVFVLSAMVAYYRFRSVSK
ncbi:DoxX family protein [Taibaiella sp. KBW10]|uniref:DoxX family protein n=1 Tax=Taibaiella sp. KBW10 TaxID=2153357 RepID=UPI000F592F62|nr:DoxX family protein [Taibaiella sp. KBW10]RQO30984.1 DoxX family protein [Taibaiella sp. KBW10]